MKLKKIASLALAGVMAVSMLAGCKGNDSSTGNQGTVVVPTTSDIVTALNNGQTSGNDVKITFTSNSTLDTYLTKAVAADSAANDTGVQTELAKYNKLDVIGTGKFYNDTDKLAFTGGTVSAANSQSKVLPVTLMKAYVVDDAYTKEGAIVDAVKQMDKTIADLKAKDVVYDATGDVYKVGNVTLDGNNNKYHTYSYTGNVSMVSETSTAGTTVYYFVMTITQTVTEQTWNA